MRAVWLFLLSLSSGALGAPAELPHQVLGVPPGTGGSALRAAYRAAALQYHPDKNPSRHAKERWLQVQQAYEALRGGGSSGGAAAFPSARQQQQSQEQRAAWQRFWQQPRPPQRIPSDTEDLNAGAFYRRVLLSDVGAGAGGGAAGGDGSSTHQPSLPWLIQIFSHSSPYCRVLNTHWEAAAREMAGLARFARIDYVAQPMLVRFLASHLRLFYSPQPSQELPTVVGFPAGCASMDCALVFGGRFTAAGLQQFAAERLLRLPALPPVSLQLLGVWRRVAAAAEPGGVALLALLPEGQPQPLELVAAVAQARAQGLTAAAAAWRPADRLLWAELGATSAPALIFWRGSAAQPAAVVQGSLLTNSIDWATQVNRHARQPLPRLHAAAAAKQQLAACQPGWSGQAAGTPSGPASAWCVLLFGRGEQLAEGRLSLEAVLERLASAAGSRGLQGWRQGAALRQAARLLAEGQLQPAWADGGQQPALCAHLLRLSGSRAGSSSCMCAPWWQRLPAQLVGRCGSQAQQQPVLMAYRQHQPMSTGSRQRSSQLLLAAYDGSLADEQQVTAWLAALGGAGALNQQQQVLLLPAPATPLAAAGPSYAASLALQLLHLASKSQLLWQEAADVASTTLSGVDWRQVALAALLGAGLLGFKWLLDLLSGTEDAFCEGWASPQQAAKAQHLSGSRKRSSSSSAARQVQEIRPRDWEPSPGRFLVVLPLQPDSSSDGSTGPGSSWNATSAQQAQPRFASLAALFQRERHLAFRVAPVSDAFAQLLSVHAGGAAAAGAAAASAISSEQQRGKQEVQPVALVLHPRRGGRFQVLPLAGMQQAVLRLEELLDGGGHWQQGAAPVDGQ